MAEDAYCSADLRLIRLNVAARLISTQGAERIVEVKVAGVHGTAPAPSGSRFYTNQRQPAASTDLNRHFCRTVTVTGRRRCLRLEGMFWTGLSEICWREKLGLGEICSTIDARRGSTKLTPSLRLFVVGYFRAASSTPVPKAPARSSATSARQASVTLKAALDALA